MPERLKQTEEEPITSFLWCGAMVIVYAQTVKFAGTTLQRHLLPTNLRLRVNQEVRKSGITATAKQGGGG
ncbi:hypothetical protein CD006_25705 [Enterobacter sp. 10-1]|nr:hypothetical protein CD006_25705 [Enterobacter sp. 10-1]